MNRLTKRYSQRGFTIIEVALVLAIAGLIFLVVFLALPALQNSQKDTARRQDVGRVVTAIENYYADGGSSSSLTSSTLAGYVEKADLAEKEPITIYGPYTGQSLVQVGDGYTGLNFVDISIGKKCPPAGSHTFSGASSPADFTVVTKLSNGTQYCVNGSD